MPHTRKVRTKGGPTKQNGTKRREEGTAREDPKGNPRTPTHTPSPQERDPATARAHSTATQTTVWAVSEVQALSALAEDRGSAREGTAGPPANATGGLAGGGSGTTKTAENRRTGPGKSIGDVFGSLG